MCESCYENFTAYNVFLKESFFRLIQNNKVCIMNETCQFSELLSLRGDSIHFVFVLVIIQVNGIKGASVFLLFKPFDLVKGFVVDWMHSVCLGVSKSLMNLWQR